MSVAKQFNNRRQPILINAIDPEILTEAKLTADGYVKNTDYATSSTGGVIRTSAGNGSQMGSGGILVPSVRTAEQYESASPNTFIGKGTLENVKDKITSGGLATFADSLAPDAAVGTVFTDLTLVKGSDGAWTVTFLTITPPETP